MPENPETVDYITRYAAPEAVFQQFMPAILRLETNAQILRLLAHLNSAEKAELNEVIAELRENMATQSRNNLISHRYDSTRSGFIEKLRRGEAIIELDFRSAADTPVASHGPKMDEGKRKDSHSLILGRNIHYHTSAELEEEFGDILTLENALEIFEPYKEHKLILDLKDEGAVLDTIALLSGPYSHLQNRIEIGTFSLKMLATLFEKLPDLAGFYLFGNPMKESPLSRLPVNERGWRRISVPFMNIYLTENKVPDEDDSPELEGFGTSVNYVSKNPPADLMAQMRQKNLKVSLGGTIFVASLISLVSPGKGQQYLAKKVLELNQKGLKTVSVTWGESLAKLPLIGKFFTPENQAKRLLAAGVEGVFTSDPVALAKKL